MPKYARCSRCHISLTCTPDGLCDACRRAPILKKRYGDIVEVGTTDAKLIAGTRQALVRNLLALPWTRRNALELALPCRSSLEIRVRMDLQPEGAHSHKYTWEVVQRLTGESIAHGKMGHSRIKSQLSAVREVKRLLCIPARGSVFPAIL